MCERGNFVHNMLIEMVEKMRRQSKKNPWRNTRNDFHMPWNKIYSWMIMISMPLALLTMAPNVIMRSGAFYSYFLSKTGVVKEIPYAIEMEDVRDTFKNFMWHKSSVFNLREQDAAYMPQMVFTKVDSQIMSFARNITDVLAVICLLAIVVAIIAAVKLFAAKKRDLLFDSYKRAMIITGIGLVICSVIIFVPTLRTGIFRGRFGDTFPPGDVLIQIFDAGFPIYYGVGCIIVTIVLALGITYLMKEFVANRKLF